MASTGKIGHLLYKWRELMYRGFFRQAVRRVGLNKLLSDPYWKLVHKFSTDVQTHSIYGHEIDFKIDSHAEFMRFRNLAGERIILEDLLCSLEPNDVVYDIGGNVGTYTCFIASILGPRQTIAFEPEPKNADRLRDNLELNELDAEVIEVALSDADGTVELALSGEKAGEGEHAIATGQNKNTIEIEMTRGDAVIEQRNLPVPSVIKIDVEGAEMSTLRGLKGVLQKHVRLVYVEIHPEKIPEFGDSVPEVRAFLNDAGFEITEMTSRGSEFFLRASKLA
ncbi:FkbM family methyltransferase [Natrialbaceae archaeon A-CW1-1]